MRDKGTGSKIQSLDRRNTQSQRKPAMTQARTSDGFQLYYETHGSGPPIVLVHELGGSHASFHFQLDAWSPRFACITYNARGYPPSEVPPKAESYSQDIAASDIAAVLDAAGLMDAHLLGVSMGAAAVLQFALRYPARTRSIVLCSIGSGSDQPQGEYRTSMEAQADFAQSAGVKALAERMLESPNRQRLKDKSPTEYRKFIEQLAAVSPLGIANTMRGVQARRPPIYVHRERIAALKIPTLIVVGDEDEPCIKPSHFLHESIPGARLEIIAKCGHLVNIEEPASLNPMALGFIERCEAERNATPSS
jgi:pimeloyl-ACP methyl ester carboxylesterase